MHSKALSRKDVENAHELNSTLEIVNKLSAFAYDNNGKEGIELDAEKVAEVLTQVVVKSPDGKIEAIDYFELIPVLIEAIKEQQKMIEELKSKLEMLKTNARR